MRAWWVFAGLGLATVAGCEDRCAKDEHVGGSDAGLEVGTHIHVRDPALLFGSDAAARESVAALMGIDRNIVASMDATAPVDCIVGRGPLGIEAHIAMRATSDARVELGRRFDLEPLMFDQFRIKPPIGPARCMLLDAQLVCASGQAKLGRGGLAVSRIQDESDAQSADLVALRIVDDETWAAVVHHLWRRVEHLMTEEKTPAPIADLVRAVDVHDLVDRLARADLTAQPDGDRLKLTVELPLYLPDGAAPMLNEVPGWIVFAQQFPVQAVPASAPPLGNGRATAYRVTDGMRFELYRAADGTTWSPTGVDAPVLAEGEDGAHLGFTVDLAAFGLEGSITGRAFEDSPGARLVITLSRETFNRILLTLLT